MSRRAKQKPRRTASHRPAVRPRRFRHDNLIAVDLFCVDGQTEILTTAGWKRYDELAVGDIALTIRPGGSAAEWQPVEAVHVFPVEQRKMQLIEGRGISALTTDNHRWLSNHRAKTPEGRDYRWRFVRSDELTCEDRIPMSAPVANLPTEPTVPDELVELVAWYWTEGTDRASGRVHIVQDHTVNPQHVEAIRSALVELFGPEREKRKRPDGPLWAENQWGNQTTFGLNRAAAAALRKAAPGKVPSIGWLTTLTQQQLDLFIQRSLDADGHERTRAGGRVERVLAQADRERASAFQAACLIAGRAASMKRYASTYRHGDTVRETVLWAVTVGMREFVKPLRQKRVEWIEHDGIVWCPTTANGTWLARRDGTCYFTGNSGFGGLTKGIEEAGFTTILAANHNEYKVEVHERNHPHAEHWIADLVDKESSDYHSVQDLPPADLLVAGVSCVNHSQANTQKAYQLGLALFELEDPEFEERATRSEKDRATATCALQYAAKHHPRMALIECTTELYSWGPQVPGKKYGDGSTYQWWLKQWENEGYAFRILYLNSMFFGVPQSRDRWYGIFWDKRMPAPDLDHRPESWCSFEDKIVQAVWTWRTGIPATGSVRYGKQYEYRCPSCRRVVIPPFAPSINALDLSDLGPKIGDRPLKEFTDKKTGETVLSPLAPSTMARAERCKQKFADFPAVLMPAKAAHGSERHPWQPLTTQTSQQETAILSTGAFIAAAGNTFERPGSDCRTRTLDEPLPSQTATNTQALLMPPVSLVTGQVMVAHRHNGDGQHITEPMDTVTTTHEKAVLLAVNNFQGSPRGVDEVLPTQGASETLGLLSAGVVPFRKNTLPTSQSEAMPTVTSDQIPGLLTAAGLVQFNQGVDRRVSGVDQPLKTVIADNTMALMFSGWYKENGKTAPHPMSDPLGTVTAHDTTALLHAQWREVLADLKLEDCHFRMMGPHEVGVGCGFDVDFGSHKGTFIVWGSARDQIDGFGNAVSPAVGTWIGLRLRAVLDPRCGA